MSEIVSYWWQYFVHHLPSHLSVGAVVILRPLWRFLTLWPKLLLPATNRRTAALPHPHSHSSHQPPPLSIPPEPEPSHENTLPKLIVPESVRHASRLSLSSHLDSMRPAPLDIRVSKKTRHSQTSIGGIASSLTIDHSPHGALRTPQLGPPGSDKADREMMQLLHDLSIEDVMGSKGELAREAAFMHGDTPRSSEQIPDVTGRVHSVESMTAVDGPGLRYLIFTQGCPRRCVFCANPDSWDPKGGIEMSSKAVAKQLRKCKPYLKPNGGGITCSGGEPLMQPHFIAAVFEEAHLLGLTTCLDTTGFGNTRSWQITLPHTDLVLLCLKSFDPHKYKELTKSTHKSAYEFAEELERRGIPWWLRFLFIPGHTDNDFEYTHCENFVKAHSSCKGVELLPYHTLGVEKWKNLGLPYVFEDMQPPPKDKVAALKQRWEAAGVPVMLAQ
ncbi:unnamed protein product [Vitrella brassicaformis CCMP3155]|uniref:Radical SAM core domain-containing protein n=2 Tax=Vitrella brassicaformis TaxID=1169539 RepID=A0A0G4EH16_VITBC|nr:unnamed protein product [Vitrella brassicaformis CCMP3155]|mmetsp:Transcript_35177/g.87355  ORF Transcript_35177/g.87355 Transcript_35177/m.87355 type:complete len:443 (+) Transcript_35177:41-1369(+)|eukprot:CEL95532.1 unnamed protein product [Vitrella brassicaformis CCMP3155]